MNQTGVTGSVGKNDPIECVPLSKAGFADPGHPPDMRGRGNPFLFFRNSFGLAGDGFRLARQLSETHPKLSGSPVSWYTLPDSTSPEHAEAGPYRPTLGEKIVLNALLIIRKSDDGWNRTIQRPATASEQVFLEKNVVGIWAGLHRY